jgi:hypothetical protein
MKKSAECIAFGAFYFLAEAVSVERRVKFLEFYYLSHI